jgi:hypothetical protein
MMSGPLPIPNGVPALKKAIEHLAYDGGVVNRYTTIEEITSHVWWELRGAYSLATLAETELELQTLSDSLLEEVCIGELMDPMPISQRTHELLNFVFDNLDPRCGQDPR